MNITFHPDPISIWPLAARLANIAALPNEWRVLVVPSGQETVTALQFVEEFRSLAALPVEHSVVHSAGDLLGVGNRQEVLVISGLEHLDELAWQSIDVCRSRLVRNSATLLVITSREAELISKLAPNFWSWLSSSVWSFVPEGGLADTAREQRLDELRRHYGFDDTELLRRARARELSPEPDFAEWLVLLGEGIPV